MRVVQVTRPNDPLKWLSAKSRNPAPVRCVSKLKLVASATARLVSRAEDDQFPIDAEASQRAETYEHMMSGKARFCAVLTTGRYIMGMK